MPKRRFGSEFILGACFFIVNMKEKKNKNCNKTYIGGQAVLEGVMMRGKRSIAIAVRDGEGVIRLEADRLEEGKSKIAKLPVVRGAVNFFKSLVTGVKIITRSAEVYGEDEAEPSKFEKWLSKTFKVDIMSVVTFIGVLLGLAFSIGLFIVLPNFLGELFVKLYPNNVLRNILEGVLRITIFIIYILLTSLLKDIKRTYMYHGAEHKTITCYEKGLPLTVENVRGCRRVHDRCGTTFMFFVMTVSIFVFTIFGIIFPFLNGEGFVYRLIRVAAKIALLPLVAGLSYELLKALAKTDSPLVFIFKLPGLLLQKLTTKEPTDDMIEVAITSFNKVLKMDADENEPSCKFACPEKANKLTEEIKSLFKEKNIDESDAEWLVSVAGGIKRSQLSSEIKISASKTEEIRKFARERLTGRPLCYVLGNCDFYGYEIKTDERALIPRPETEELVERAMKDITKDSEVLDMCTGSGAIALAVRKKTGASVTASDISPEALSLAKENFDRYGEDIKIVESDVFDRIEGKFDVVICNPPYIKSGAISRLQTEIKDFEPRIALDGGDDGLDFYRTFSDGLINRLKENGKVFLEIGYDQGEAVSEIMSDKGFETEIIKDISGNDRIVKAELK